MLNVQNELIKNDKLMFGTVDTWIIWNLTNRKKHLTDFTNASRTLLYNINDKKWDNELLKLFNVPKKFFLKLKILLIITGYIKNITYLLMQ